ncbi:MAG: zf-HC2 domain-containing protein, partial [Rhizobiaceae bacterium]|nr:zf-HC2 domain-containing protein [Rhizobiaceae bacterium]
MSDEHQEWTPMLHGFIDDELDAVHSARFEAHLATCPDCQAELEKLQTMRRRIGQNGVRWRTPDDVRTRILASIAQEGTAAPASATLASGNSAWRRNLRFIREWSFVPSIAALAASLMLFVSVPRPQDISLEDQVLASHVRSMLADHLTDV